MSFRYSKVAILAISLVFMGGSCGQNLYSTFLSELNLSGMESQVIEKIDSLRNIVIENPDSAGAWGKLGMNLYVHEMKEESILCFEKAALLDTTDFRWSYLAGYTRTILHFPGTIAWFARSLRLNPRYAPLYLRYGDALFMEGRISEAGQLYRQAGIVNPPSSHAYLGRARVAMAEDDYQASLRYLQRALELNSRHGEVYGLLATVYRRMKMIDKAKKAMQVARTLAPDTKIKEPIISAIIQEGESSYWYAYRGGELMARARYHAAIKEYKQAIKYNPSADSFRDLGNIYRTLRQYDEAITFYRQAIASKPGDLQTTSVLFTVFTEIGKHAEAIKILRAALPYHPDDVNLNFHLAWLLATSPDGNLRDGAKAVRHAELICQKTNYKDSALLDVLAAAFAEAGDFTRAAEVAGDAHKIALQSEQFLLAKKIEERLNLYHFGKPFHNKHPILKREGDEKR